MQNEKAKSIKTPLHSEPNHEIINKPSIQDIKPRELEERIGSNLKDLNNFNKQENEKTITRNSYSFDLLGNKIKTRDRNEKNDNKKFGRGIKFMFEPSQITQSLIFEQNNSGNIDKNKAIGVEHFNKLKEILNKKEKKEEKTEFFLGAPRYYPKEKLIKKK